MNETVYYATKHSVSKSKGTLIVVHGDLSCTGIKAQSVMTEVTRKELSGRRWRKCSYCA